MSSFSNSSIHQTQIHELSFSTSSKLSSGTGSDIEERPKQARLKLFSTPSSTSLSSLGSKFTPKIQSRNNFFLSITFPRSNSNLSAHSLALQSKHQKLTQDWNTLLWVIIKQQRECAAVRRELKNTRSERQNLEEQLKDLIPQIEKIRALETEQEKALREEEATMKSIDEKDGRLRKKMKDVLNEMDDHLPYKREVLKKEKKEEKRWQEQDERELKEEQKELRRQKIEQELKSAQNAKSDTGEEKRNEHAVQEDEEMKGKVHANLDGKRVDEADRRKEVETRRSGKTAGRRSGKETEEFQRGLFKQKHPGASHSYIVYQ